MHCRVWSSLCYPCRPLHTLPDAAATARASRSAPRVRTCSRLVRGAPPAPSPSPCRPSSSHSLQNNAHSRSGAALIDNQCFRVPKNPWHQATAAKTRIKTLQVVAHGCTATHLTMMPTPLYMRAHLWDGAPNAVCSASTGTQRYCHMPSWASLGPAPFTRSSPGAAPSTITCRKGPCVHGHQHLQHEPSATADHTLQFRPSMPQNNPNPNTTYQLHLCSPRARCSQGCRGV